MYFVAALLLYDNLDTFNFFVPLTILLSCREHANIGETSRQSAFYFSLVTYFFY